MLKVWSFSVTKWSKTPYLTATNRQFSLSILLGLGSIVVDGNDDGIKGDLIGAG